MIDSVTKSVTNFVSESVTDSVTESVTDFVTDFKNILKISEYYFYYKKIIILTSIIPIIICIILFINLLFLLPTINHFNEILGKVHQVNLGPFSSLREPITIRPVAIGITTEKDDSKKLINLK